MKQLYGYVMLFIYSCLSSILMLLLLGGGIAIFYFLKGNEFNFPLGQLKRAIVFGCIAGSAITLATIVFNLIDKINARKKPPSDPK
ncbi:hypothetical protein FDX19_20135 [Citrobacter sp. wls619]|uniref:hypothetical protein n=1 Tax=Citrobacter sp. wls619 TaxID=2576432 RepID=UPI0010C97342|nr:hypothetical protein [Citrobacter sp. wls619]TKV06291.1 hypothetical protein FDX19_20135 [Citrobacter sp. wls619]